MISPSSRKAAKAAKAPQAVVGVGSGYIKHYKTKNSPVFISNLVDIPCFAMEFLSETSTALPTCNLLNLMKLFLSNCSV